MTNDRVYGRKLLINRKLSQDAAIHGEALNCSTAQQIEFCAVMGLIEAQFSPKDTVASGQGLARIKIEREFQVAALTMPDESAPASL